MTIIKFKLNIPLMLQNIQDYPALKLLGDPRRLAILQILMQGPASLTTLGQKLRLSPARVQHHLLQLIDAGFAYLTETRQVRGFTAKYYQATAQAYWINLTLTAPAPENGAIVILGSNDPALNLLADHLNADQKTPSLMAYPIGSLNGLTALRQGLCQLTACHLFDPISAEYNTSYVRHFFPGQPMHVVTLAHREQGLILAPGNPHGVQSLHDLTRPELTLVNREKGSGTRLWLDHQLHTLGIPASAIQGYDNCVNTHAEVAQKVLSGTADVGVGLLAEARNRQLTFIPLFNERFDLVIPSESINDPLLAPLLDRLNSAQFKRQIMALGGYDPHDSGSEIKLTAF